MYRKLYRTKVDTVRCDLQNIYSVLVVNVHHINISRLCGRMMDTRVNYQFSITVSYAARFIHKEAQTLHFSGGDAVHMHVCSCSTRLNPRLIQKRIPQRAVNTMRPCVGNHRSGLTGRCAPVVRARGAVCIHKNTHKRRQPDSLISYVGARFDSPT